MLIIISTGSSVSGQRISFGTWAGSNSISIQGITDNGALNFGNLYPGVSKSITLSSNDAAVFEITAETGYDLTVSMISPSALTGPGTKTIPFHLSFAYSNQGMLNVTAAKTSATEVSSGMTSVTFPLRKYTSGLPAPPPNPLDGNNPVRMTAKAYLFIYGSIGPVASDASAGVYTGTVNITVEYAQ